MRKKHYDPNTLFFVVYAVNEKEEIGKSFKIKTIENITLDLHNFLEDREIDVSDGEIADKLGYQGANKEPFSNYTRWGIYRQGTCYYISEGLYESRSVAISNGCNIIPAGNFINYYKKYLNMKKRNIQITLEQAREWYGSENQTLKTLALSAFKKEELELTLNEIFTRVKYSSTSIPIVDNVLKVTILSYLAMLAKYFNENKPIPTTQFFIKGKDDNGEILLAFHTGVKYPGIIYFNHLEDLRKAIKLIGDDIKYLFE